MLFFFNEGMIVWTKHTTLRQAVIWMGPAMWTEKLIMNMEATLNEIQSLVFWQTSATQSLSLLVGFNFEQNTNVPGFSESSESY